VTISGAQRGAEDSAIAKISEKNGTTPTVTTELRLHQKGKIWNFKVTIAIYTLEKIYATNYGRSRTKE
jgi:hypothetical protein